MSRPASTAWVDCGSGVSGDMLLGALVDLGADVADVVAALDVGATLETSTISRGGMRAVAVDVRSSSDQPLRTLADLLDVAGRAALPAVVADQVRGVLLRLATAEARVHGTSIGDVHFHEVGAVDTIVDIVGVCTALHRLGVTRLTAGPLALGGGSVDTAHGRLPVPGPAVLELLSATGLTAYGGTADVELATPTGVALLAELATASGPLPPMEVAAVGVGAGSRDRPGQPNVVRVVMGAPVEPGDHADTATAPWLLLEANVDDLDPRLWPEVLDRLLAAGGADAWLSPIHMKKGRPAHTVSALTDAAHADAVRTALFRESSTIGVRATTVAKWALDRDWRTVDVDGEQVRVKVAMLAGDVVNVSPEWEDVVAAAHRLGRPAKAVLAEAVARAGVRPG